ncbi:MAG: hypothetical protein AABX17_02100 [Nanoarchaeota archaeon]
MIIKNKQAGERYLSIWMFINWIIIGGCIVLGALIFLDVLADARLAESQILTDRLGDCLSKDFTLEKFNSDEFDIYSRCGLNRATIEDSNFYYINVTLQETESGKAIKQILGGKGTFEVMCNYQFSNQKREENFAKCGRDNLIVEDEQTKIKYTFSIVSASNQL